EPGLERREDLRGHDVVGLAEELTPFAVTDDDPAAAGLDQHRRADLARERARIALTKVLRGDLDAAAVALVRARRERRVRRRNDHVDMRQARDEVHQLAGERAAARAAVVHLPVARDERPPRLVHADTGSSPVRRTSMPGSFLPSMSSREAPPPVEMCFILEATSPPAA